MTFFFKGEEASGGITKTESFCDFGEIAEEILSLVPCD